MGQGNITEEKGRQKGQAERNTQVTVGLHRNCQMATAAPRTMATTGSR